MGRFLPKGRLPNHCTKPEKVATACSARRVGLSAVCSKGQTDRGCSRSDCTVPYRRDAGRFLRRLAISEEVRVFDFELGRGAHVCWCRTVRRFAEDQLAPHLRQRRGGNARARSRRACGVRKHRLGRPRAACGARRARASGPLARRAWSTRSSALRMPALRLRSIASGPAAGRHARAVQPRRDSRSSRSRSRAMPMHAPPARDRSRLGPRDRRATRLSGTDRVGARSTRRSAARARPDPG